MVKIFFSCHVEPQRKTEDIDYFHDFIQDLIKLGKPVHLSLMLGENAKDKVFRFFQNKTDVPAFLSLGLHVHGKQTVSAISNYTKVFSQKPKTISFGHWSFREPELRIAAQNGVKYDLSYAAYRHNEKYFTKKSFGLYGLKEIPVCCNPKYPVNPFYGIYNLFIFFLLISVYFFSNRTLHFSFHSYEWNKKLAKIVFNLPVKYVSI